MDSVDLLECQKRLGRLLKERVVPSLEAVVLAQYPYRAAHPDIGTRVLLQPLPEQQERSMLEVKPLAVRPCCLNAQLSGY
jgi:hypothetical protein